MRFLTMLWNGAVPEDFGAVLAQHELRFDAVVLSDAVTSGPDLLPLLDVVLPFLRPGAPILAAAAGQGQLCETLDTQGFVIDRITAVQPPDGDETAATPVVLRLTAPSHAPRRILIRAITLKPIGACNDTRIDLPLSYLSTIPGVEVSAAVERLADHPTKHAEGQKVAIFQRRMIQHDNVQGFAQIRRLGYLIVSEFDDLPTRWPQIAVNDHLTFRGVHAVQTSTEPLVEFLSRFNPELGLFHNQIAMVPPRRTPSGEGVTIFFGALNREADWRDLTAPLNAVVRQSRVPVGFHVVHDRKFFDALETDRKTFMPTCDYNHYTAIMRACDIALLPLNDTDFNRAKSDLKFIECAVHGVVALASPVVYSRSLRDGDTGALFASPQEFAERLAALIGDADARRAIADRAHAYVLNERLMAQHFRRHYEWYSDLLARKPTLDAALRDRVPEMFL
ncbi:glycosyltransferase [Azospirillum sp. sgz301742]